MYDYLIVGAGLSGATFAQRMAENGKKCLVIDKRNHIGGNVYTKNIEGIQVHVYGPHVFHTKYKKVWEYVNRFATFNHYRCEPIANYKGQLYNLPFNMNTFHQMWGVNTPDDALSILEQQRREITTEPRNLEEQAIKLVGRDIYLKLIKGYTEKQWGRDCKDLPPFIIRRLPVRMRYDNNYFNDPFQGIPIGGYTKMVENMLNGIEVKLNTPYKKGEFDAERIYYTGPIDEYLDYKLGALEYRSLRFENELLDIPNYQGISNMNFTDRETPFTRIVEHKHFEFQEEEIQKTVITKEFSSEWKQGDEPYYPVNDDKNQELYKKYLDSCKKESNIIFAGRLADYKYYNMDETVARSLDIADKEIISN